MGKPARRGASGVIALFRETERRNRDPKPPRTTAVDKAVRAIEIRLAGRRGSTLWLGQYSQRLSYRSAAKTIQAEFKMGNTPVATIERALREAIEQKRVQVTRNKHAEFGLRVVATTTSSSNPEHGKPAPRYTGGQASKLPEKDLRL